MTSRIIIGYESFLNKSFWPIDETLKEISLSRPGSNDDEGILHTSQNSKTRATQSNIILYHAETTFLGGVFSLCWWYSQCSFRLAAKPE